MASRGGLLGRYPNVRPRDCDGCAALDACFAAPSLDLKPLGLFCERCAFWPNTDLDADGGGPIGVVEGMGSRRSKRSGVEGGSEEPGTVNFIIRGRQ